MASDHLCREVWGATKLTEKFSRDIEDLWDMAIWLEEVNLLPELEVMMEDMEVKDVTPKNNQLPTNSPFDAGECDDFTASEVLKKSEVMEESSHEVAEAQLLEVGEVSDTAVGPVLSSWQELQVAELRSKEALKKRLETQVAILKVDIQQIRQDLASEKLVAN